MASIRPGMSPKPYQSGSFMAALWEIAPARSIDGRARYHGRAVHNHPHVKPHHHSEQQEGFISPDAEFKFV